MRQGERVYVRVPEVFESGYRYRIQPGYILGRTHDDRLNILFYPDDVRVFAPSDVFPFTEPPCPVCYGWGRVRRWFFGFNRKCSSCNGTGMESHETERE